MSKTEVPIRDALRLEMEMIERGAEPGKILALAAARREAIQTGALLVRLPTGVEVGA